MIFFPLQLIRFYTVRLIAYVLVICAWTFTKQLADKVDADGNLPWWLRWFQTVDATCYDTQYIADNPQWSKYEVAYNWLRRNPAYGYNHAASAFVSANEKVKVFGDLTIQDGKNGKAGWYFIITSSGVFEYRSIFDLGNGHCVIKEYGWNLTPLAKGYTSSVLGDLLVVFFCRFNNFGTDGK